MKRASWILFAAGFVGFSLLGCTKGPFWRTGYLSPWAQQRWADEERISPTLFSKRADLEAMVQSAIKGSVADRERTASQLAKIAQNDPVMLMRLEAVKLLGDLDTPAARTAIGVAAKDPQSDVRMAAIYACAKRNDPESVQILQEIIGSDTDMDIRLAATRTLKNFHGPEAVQALALALDDPNPALQLRAADSLQAVTGKSFGHDVRAWQEYVRQSPAKDVSKDAVKLAGHTDGEEPIRR